MNGLTKVKNDVKAAFESLAVWEYKLLKEHKPNTLYKKDSPTIDNGSEEKFIFDPNLAKEDPERFN